MDLEDHEWVVEQFTIAFVVDVRDRAPDMEPTDMSTGAYDLAHVFGGDNEPSLVRHTLGGIDDVLAGQPLRRDGAGHSALMESNGTPYLFLDYSEIIIRRDTFEIWSHASVGGRAMVGHGTTQDLRRFVALWCEFVEEQWPLHEAFQRL